MTKKGDIVFVRAVVSTKNDPKPFGIDWPGKIIHEPNDTELDLSRNSHKRVMRRHTLKDPVVGLVIGRSTRITGWYRMGGYDDPGWLFDTTTHKVVMVMSMENQRYLTPWACLEKDLLVTK